MRCTRWVTAARLTPARRASFGLRSGLQELQQVDLIDLRQRRVGNGFDVCVGPRQRGVPVLDEGRLALDQRPLAIAAPDDPPRGAVGDGADEPEQLGERLAAERDEAALHELEQHLGDRFLLLRLDECPAAVAADDGDPFVRVAAEHLEQRTRLGRASIREQLPQLASQVHFHGLVVGNGHVRIRC
jgi:hypothetical protein